MTPLAVQVVTKQLADAVLAGAMTGPEATKKLTGYLQRKGK